MKDSIPPKPEGYTLLSFLRRRVWECIWDGKFPFGDTDTVKHEWRGGFYYFKAAPPSAAGSSGGWQGEYDQTKSYSAGEWMIISQALTIDGKTCPPGIIAVDPAYTDIYGNIFSGNLPANPTGANVPQSPLPTPGTVTNAARYILLFCQSV